MEEGEPDLMRGDIFIIPSTIDRKIWIDEAESGNQRGIDKGGTVRRKQPLL